MKYTNISPEEARTVKEALEILGRQVRTSDCLTGPESVRNYLRVRYGGERRELFVVLFLDPQYRIIADEVFSLGTITQAAVYPREIARRVLELDAHAVILSHNHPDGAPTPSGADRALTETLRTALDLFDCRVLDHVITTAAGTFSFAEGGIL